MFTGGPADGLPSALTIADLRADALRLLQERSPALRGGGDVVRLPTRRVTGKTSAKDAAAAAGSQALREQ
eukprot:487702-Heterocapsa_arctica.AAC.1